jgi:catechol 2,3-dioxygenase-like lactoylglutathione lyase family enzyme
MGARVHHSAIHVHDLDASLRFYRDGVGLDVLMDREFEGDWPALFDVPTTRLRSVFLGDHRHPDAGVVELVDFVGAAAGHPGTPEAAGSPAVPAGGFFLLSFFVDVDAVLGRLEALGHGRARRIEQPGPAGPLSMATVVDPDGVRVELIDATGPASTPAPGRRPASPRG